jgi:hypothetical protein
MRRGQETGRQAHRHRQAGECGHADSPRPGPPLIRQQDLHQVIGPFTLYKHREDLIDALLCAWTASLWASHSSGLCQVPRPARQRNACMTVRSIAVILGTGNWSPGKQLPGSFEIGCGVTVHSGDDDERTWSQRYKANLEKLASGDLVQVVEVVRDLAGREANRGLSAGEKRMLAKARLILLQEG